MSTEVTKKVIPNLSGSIKEIPQVDTTLTKEGRSADAKVVGDILADHKRRIDNIDPHFAKNVQFDNSASWTTSEDLQGAMFDALKRTEVYENAGYMANHWSGSNNYVVVGKICILNFDIQNGLSPAPANAVFVTDLPKPKKSVNFTAWEFDNDYVFGLMPCGVTANGELCIHKQLTYQHRFSGTVAYQIA
jgi:hypothetical protein